MNNKITEEDLQLAAATFIAIRKQLGLMDNMIYTLVVDMKDNAQYVIKCEKREGEKI